MKLSLNYPASPFTRRLPAIAGSIILMKAGTIISQGSPKEVLQNSGNEFSEIFFEKDRWVYEMQLIKVEDLDNQYSKELSKMSISDVLNSDHQEKAEILMKFINKFMS